MLAVVLVLASVTDKLATFATNVVGDLGLPGIFLLMAPESACIPIPSEATMLFAGFNVAKGEYSLFAAVLVGSLANLVGSWVAYALGYYGRLELLEKHGRALHIKPQHLAWADRWFARYGDAAVFFSRMLPIVRTFISVPAGIARMPLWRFLLFSIVGAVPWVMLLVWAGMVLGDNWQDLKHQLRGLDYIVVGLIVLGVGVFIWRHLRSR